MVIWLFVGGGESEIQGLVPFLRNNFPQYSFERKLPVILKPGPKYNCNAPLPLQQPGLTGKNLIDKIVNKLDKSFNFYHESCDLILTIDDLDCRCPAVFTLELVCRINNLGINLPIYTGFAKPEIEAWIIADWARLIQVDPEFRMQAHEMRTWLSDEGVDFDHPETFGIPNPATGACIEKLSDIIIESCRRQSGWTLYKKGQHTSKFLLKMNSDVVKRKCPHFRMLFDALSNLDCA